MGRRRTVRRRVVGAGVGLAVVAVGVFGVLAPPESCPEVSVDDLEDASALTVDWFVSNQNDDGTWLYQYEADRDRVVPDYNIVRHAGVIMGLYQAAVAGYPGALESADTGLEWLLDRTFVEGEWTAIVYQGEVSVGSVALLTAGLVDRREATGDDRHDDLLGRLGGFMAQQTEPSGAVLAYYSRIQDAPIPETYSKYYTGEAYWALSRLHRAFPDEGWGEIADRVGDYLATRRDDIEDNWPVIPDHWAAYGLAETVEFADRPGGSDGSGGGEGPLTEAEIAYAEEQAGLFGSQVRWVSQRHGPWGLAVRGPHVPRGGGYGVVGEALTGYWRVVEAEPRLHDLREPVAERTRCIAGLAIEAQTDEDEAEDYERPERAAGAWFRDGETRMDDQQHALAALLRTVAIVEAGAGDAGPGGGEGGDMPAFWLWLLALVAVVNPFRTALAVPRAGRSRREVAEVALLGGAAAGAGVLLVAWASGPLLDALDVSGPALRLAAGIVAGVGGLMAVFRRPPPSDPALPGRRAALVPVAVPLVATPALLLAVMSAHSDRGFPVLLAALALAIAALGLITLALPSDPTAPPVDTAGDLGAPAVDAGAASQDTAGDLGAPAVDPGTAGQDAADQAARPVDTAGDLGGPAVALADVDVDARPDQRVPANVTVRLVAWAGRLTAAGLVAAAVALVIDGVLAV